MWGLAICPSVGRGGGKMVMTRIFLSKGDIIRGHLSIYHSMVRVNSTQVRGGGGGGGEGGEHSE